MIIIPNWNVPAHIHALTTTRDNGNLALHVEDDPVIVAANRARVIQEYAIPTDPYWLNQTHSPIVLRCNEVPGVPEADGSYTQEKNAVCAVLTADCLPILLCDEKGQEVAALHAGWRGLQREIIAAGVEKFSTPREKIIAWLGPAIGPQAFEVGEDVYQAFTAQYPAQKSAFSPSDRVGHYLLDIYALAKQYLNREGIMHISGGEYCTYSQPELFYSYRREGKTGRMATFVWVR